MNLKQFTLALGAIVLVGSVFVDTAASAKNRTIPRLNSAQAQDWIIGLNHLSRPIHDKGFPNGDIDLIFGDMEW